MTPFSMLSNLSRNTANRIFHNFARFHRYQHTASSSSKARHSARATIVTLVGTTTAFALYIATSQSVLHSENAATAEDNDHLRKPLPSRKELLNALKRSSILKDNKYSQEFDLLVVGGGATGAGVALDAATRGLKVACVERDDWAAGTSSRSTKLVHGGVRYLEKAFLELDYEQWKLVREALHERSTFLKLAPYLAYQLPIMLPVYKWWKVPYFWVGSKAYDLLAGKQGLDSSYFLSRSKALEVFPMLKKDSLCGAIVYYDGAQNDSRMNVALALTAIQHGAIVTNHTEIVSLIKEPSSSPETPPQIRGAIVRDTLTGEEFTVRCKGVVNATGPFTDGIRKLDEPSTEAIVSPSAGVHVILPDYYAPSNMGLVDPNTSDGRVIFFLPWLGHTIAGTTDSPTTVTPDPIPEERDIDFILKEVGKYLSSDIKVRKNDVLSAWSGIRPLVRDPSARNTAALVRNHMINVSPSGLLTIAGGKWTTYRAMAEETVDKAIEVFNLQPTGPCVTTVTPLIGTKYWSSLLYIKLAQHFGISTEIAKHLSESYGDRSWNVMSLASETGHRWPILGKRLVPDYPYLKAEVRYACRNEYACTAIDVLARRTRLAFLNSAAAWEATPRVISIMQEELGWSRKRCTEETESVKKFLVTMGLPAESMNSKAITTEGSTSFWSRVIPFSSASKKDV